MVWRNLAVSSLSSLRLHSWLCTPNATVICSRFYQLCHLALDHATACDEFYRCLAAYLSSIRDSSSFVRLHGGAFFRLANNTLQCLSNNLQGLSTVELVCAILAGDQGTTWAPVPPTPFYEAAADQLPPPCLGLQSLRA